MASRDHYEKTPDTGTSTLRVSSGRSPASPRRPIVVVAVALAAAVVAASVALLLGGGLAKADEVRFQTAGEPGPGAFTAPVDLPRADGGSESSSQSSSPSGDDESATAGSGASRGGGSGHVCDREKLIRELAARPDRLRAWAEVVGVEPTEEAVAAYIRQLRPMTLTRDTQVTNHSYSNRSAQPFQAVLDRGTAVLVDEDGKLVARCRCGNPLAEPVELAQETKCYACPRDYEPPAPCDYYDYEDADFRRYDDEEFAREYRPSDYEGACYTPALSPPPVEEPTAPVCTDPPSGTAEDLAVDEPASAAGDDTAVGGADVDDPSAPSSDETASEEAGVEDPSALPSHDTSSEDSATEDPSALPSDDMAAEEPGVEDPSAPSTDEDLDIEGPSAPTSDDTSAEDAGVEDPSAPSTDEDLDIEDPSAPTSDDTSAEDAGVEDPSAPSTDEDLDIEDPSAPTSEDTSAEDAGVEDPSVSSSEDTAAEETTAQDSTLSACAESATTDESAPEGQQPGPGAPQSPLTGASGLTGTLMTTGLAAAEIGSSLSEVEQRTGVTLERQGLCASPPGGGVSFEYQGDTISAVVVSGDSGITTKSGIGLGDSLDQVFATYGDAERLTGSESFGQGPDALYRDASGNGVVFWADPDGAVSLIAAGNADDLAQRVEFCA